MPKLCAVLPSLMTLLPVQAQPPTKVPMTPDVRTVSDSSNNFAFDLYSRLAKTKKENFLFSPASIHTIFSMVQAGAKGNTASEIQISLYAQKNTTEGYGKLIKGLNASSLTSDGKPAYELTVSNGMWPAKAFPFEASYTDLLKNTFAASVQELDYKEAEGARKIINDAVAQQTKDKIKDLLPSGLLNATTRLVLTNAVYFKSAWARPFIPDFTKKTVFQPSSKRKVSCQMMHQTERFNYFENDRMQILELPYASHELSMLVLLPKKLDGVSTIEKHLNDENLQDWCSKTKPTLVEVSLPKFTFSTDFMLAGTLQAMGIKDVFSAKADLSGMTKADKLSVTEAIHKTFVAVDEKGTEAAAATFVGTYGSAPKPQKPKVFNANHPFLFLIRHNKSGAHLFVGRLVTPE